MDADNIQGKVYNIPFPNGKHYVGITTCAIKKRENEHRCAAKSGASQVLYNALRKYNMVDEAFCYLVDTASTLNELFEKEKYYIKQFNSHYLDGHGYNMTFGGEGNHGYVYTEEDKQRISQAQKMRFENPEEREKLAAKSRTFWNGNTEAKQNMREMKIQQCTEEWCEKQSERISEVHRLNPNLAKEHGESMKRIHKENPNIAKEHSKRLKQMHQENPDLAKEKGAKLKKLYEERPELREKISVSQKKRFEDPNARKKLSETRVKLLQEHPELRVNKSMKLNPFEMFRDKELIGSYDYKFQAVADVKDRFGIVLYGGNIDKILQGKGFTSKGFSFKYRQSSI